MSPSKSTQNLLYRFDRILCPTDFSESSIEAIRIAAFAVKRFNGSLTLLYVDEHEVNPMGYHEKDPAKREGHRRTAREFAEERFNDLITRLEIDAARTARLVRFGTAYKEIIHEAETNAYHAIALATNGIGCASPHLIGSTAERIVRLSRTPVLTVREPGARLEWKTKTILCPTDFSEYGNYILPYALSIAQAFSAKIILLHITDLSVEFPERLIERFPDPGTYLEQTEGIPIERFVDKDIDPGNAIVRVAQEYEADLVVMGTHGGKGMKRVQIGHTTEEVIRRVTIPVLSVTHPIHKVVFPRRFAEDYQLKTGS